MKNFQQLFNNLIQYENKIPGIAQGLEVLRSFDNIKDFVGSKNEVKYYNFVDKCFYYYSFDSLNIKMQQLVIKLIEKEFEQNVLYQIFFQKFVETKNKFKYRYMNPNVNEHTILKKLFHGFRVNLKKDFKFIFQLSEVIKVFPCSYFVSTVSTDDFYGFIIEYISSLNDVLVFDRSNGFICFLLDFCSFLGKHDRLFHSLNLSNIKFDLESIYQKYLVSSQSEKYHIQGYIFWYVLCSTTDNVSSDIEFNNTFLDLFKN